MTMQNSAFTILHSDDNNDDYNNDKIINDCKGRTCM